MFWTEHRVQTPSASVPAAPGGHGQRHKRPLRAAYWAHLSVDSSHCQNPVLKTPSVQDICSLTHGYWINNCGYSLRNQTPFKGDAMTAGELLWCVQVLPVTNATSKRCVLQQLYKWKTATVFGTDSFNWGLEWESWYFATAETANVVIRRKKQKTSLFLWCEVTQQKHKLTSSWLEPHDNLKRHVETLLYDWTVSSTSEWVEWHRG